MKKKTIPQGGGSFVRQSNGSLKQVEKPTADPVHKPVPKAAPKKEAK